MKKDFIIIFLLVYLFIGHSPASTKTIDVETENLKINASVIYSHKVEMGWKEIMLHGLSVAVPGNTDMWPFYGYSLNKMRQSSVCDSESPYADSKAGNNISFVVPERENHPNYIGWNIRLQKKNENPSNTVFRLHDLCSIIQSQDVMGFIAEELYRYIGQSVQDKREWYLLIDEPIADLTIDLRMATP